MDDDAFHEHPVKRRRGRGYDSGGEVSQEFDVVCLGGGVAGEAIAEGLRNSGLTLAVVERELVGGECPVLGMRPIQDPASLR